MAPKRRIRKRKPHRSSIRLTQKKVHKRRLKDALVTKAKRTKAKRQSPKRTPGSTPQDSKSRGIALGTAIPHPPARGPGRPSRFDETEEVFLSKVPKQLKQYAFKPGHAPTPGGGRPAGTPSLTTRLRGILNTKIEGRDRKKGCPAVTYADELMALAVQAARRGDYRFFQHIYERMDGKIPDHIVVEEVQQLVEQEAEKLVQDLMKVVEEVTVKELGDKRAAVLNEKLQSQLTEKMGEKDVGRRAS